MQIDLTKNICNITIYSFCVDKKVSKQKNVEDWNQNSFKSTPPEQIVLPAHFWIAEIIFHQYLDIVMEGIYYEDDAAIMACSGLPQNMRQN